MINAAAAHAHAPCIIDIDTLLDDANMPIAMMPGVFFWFSGYFGVWVAFFSSLLYAAPYISPFLPQDQWVLPKPPKPTPSAQAENSYPDKLVLPDHLGTKPAWIQRRNVMYIPEPAEDHGQSPTDTSAADNSILTHGHGHAYAQSVHVPYPTAMYTDADADTYDVLQTIS